MATPTPPDLIRQARRQWLDTGTVASGLIAGPLQASWARCRDLAQRSSSESAVCTCVSAMRAAG